MKKLTSTSLRFIPGALGLACCLLASNASAAVLYFDPNGASPVTAGTYTWDTTSLEWSTSSALTGSPVAWNSADAANFCAGSFTGNITVDVNSAINVAGMFNGNLTPPGCNLTLAGTGSLNLPSGAQAWGEGGSDGNYVIMNVPITGPGAPESEMNGNGLNNLYLYSPNTYTGGFVLGASSNGGTPPNAGVNFNNNTAFGIGGTISSSSSSAQRNILTPLAAQTPGALVLSQGLTLWNGVFSYSGVAIAPVTFSGNVALGSTTSTIQVQSTTDAGAGTATLTLAGIVSGAGNLAKTGAGVLVLSGANTYSGSTTISAGRLTLGAANTIASSSSVIMAGGTLDPDGFHHAMTATTLGLTASSILDYSSGAAEIDFANSSGVAWTSGMTLNLVSTGGGNWNNSSDYLEVGTATGLTSGQLAEIEFNGTDLGDAGITSQGYIIDTAQIPEPSTVVLSLLGGLGLLWNIRRRAV